MREFSYYKPPIKNLAPRFSWDLKTASEYIKGDTQLMQLTEQLRGINDEKEQKEQKAKILPYCTFSGIFNKRADAELVKHSSLICVDLDDVGHNGEITAIADTIKKRYTPGMMFISPRGRGLKLIFEVDINEGSHAEYVDALHEFLTTTANLPPTVLDKGARAISQACFLCHDPKVFYTDKPAILNREFLVKYQHSDLIADQPATDDASLYDNAKKWVDGKQSFISGNRNTYMTALVDTLNRFGVSEDFALLKLTEFAQADFTSQNIAVIVKSRYKHVEHHGVAESITATNTVPGKTSLPPFIRVGTSFYKVIKKSSRYSIKETHLKPWNKDTLLQDFKRKILQVIPKYDDFVMVPDNVSHKAVVNGGYNLYSPFNHVPAPGKFTWTERLLKHVFGDQYELGLRYMQILYLYPQRSTIILVLVSKIRGTGKTTFSNWLNMLFGANAVLLSSTDFLTGFNGIYGTKNIIIIEETLLEKNLSIEKLKALTTQKFISINEKYTQQYMVPFYGKFILTSNHEDRFARIDGQEIRFLVRKLPVPEFTNHSIEKDLLEEIPAFLDFLKQQPPVDWSVSRSGFTSSELYNKYLFNVVEESKSGLYKDLKMQIIDVFENSTLDDFHAAPLDIKEKFFYHDNQISLSYIRRVLREEFELQPAEESIRYNPFADKLGANKTGRPYYFERLDFTTLPNEGIPF